MKLRTPSLPLLATAAALTVAAPASAAETQIAVEQKPFVASSLGAAVVWSSYDAQAGDYRLVTLKDGTITPLPVAPSATPFDPDLGTNRSGSAYAVYTRSVPGDGGSSDIYRLSLGTGREQRLATFGSPATDERQPTIWRGDIAFARREKHGSRSYEVIRLGNTTHTGKPRIVVQLAAVKGTIYDLQLALGRLAYVVAQRGGDRTTEAIHLLDLRTGRDRTIYRAVSGAMNAANVTRPSFSADGRTLYWARTNRGSGRGNRYVRYTVATGRFAYAQGSPDIVSASWAGGDSGFFAVHAPAEAAARLVVTGPPSFTAQP